MKKITLFVGDCDNSIAQAAQQFDSGAILIDHNNYNFFLNTSTSFTGYTSIADLPKIIEGQQPVLFKLLNQADCIIYHPPRQWSDNKTINFEDPTDSMQGLTENFLYIINKNKNNVIGLDLKAFPTESHLRLTDSRKSNDPQLWVVGCSTTAGVGVSNEERYGYLLGKSLSLPVSFLTEPGSSISWAADQILRSDINSGDIVVWGLTNESRMAFWSEIKNKEVHINAHSNLDVEYTSLSTSLINKLLTHKTTFHTAIQKVHEVVNFCHKINAKLLILNIHSSNTLNICLQNIKEFFPCLQQLIDVGTDQRHPGPKSHQAYADFCQSALKKLQYI